MKFQIFTVGLVLSLGAQLSHAEDKAPVSTGKEGPCKAVMDACRAAGYTQSGHKDGKGIHADCVGKLFKGESVSGVSVTAEQIEACQNRHQLMMQDKGTAHPHGVMPAPSPNAAVKK